LIFGGYSPFGAGFVAALGSDSGALFGIAGAIFGYFSMLHKANGLKYVAICILIYTASFVFRDTSLGKKTWFMPIASFVCAAAIGIVFLADAGFKANDTVFYLTELIIIPACAYFYQYFFNSRVKSRSSNDKMRAVSCVVILATLIVPLSQTTIIGAVSAGRALAVVMVMLASYYGGVGLGSCTGIAFGLAVGIAGGSADYCAIYGFAGLFAGIFAKKNKLVFAIAYVLANTAAMLWVAMGVRLEILYEAFFASVLFLIVGDMCANTIKSFLISASDAPLPTGYAERVRSFAGSRLRAASTSFRELSIMLTSLFKREDAVNCANITTVFDRPAKLVCRKCTLSGACWERDYITTRDALNEVTKVMRERGRVEAADFPTHFSARCVKISEFVSAVNEELAQYLYRNQCAARVGESRSMVCRQYDSMAQVFCEMSTDIALDPRFDMQAEDKLQKVLNAMDSAAQPCVYRDAANHIHVELSGRDLDAILAEPETFRNAAGAAIGIGLTTPERAAGTDEERIIMRQREPLCATIGVAVHKKRDSEMSGDSGSYFKLDDGKLCVILSDGMGTGKAAAAMSATAISILERFLKSGIDPKCALATINSALVLKGEECGAFTTLDFMQIDLYTGDTSFYKLGSAPSYVKRDMHVRRIASESLPAGIPCANPSDIERMRIRLHYKDFVVLATDGVADAGDDKWLMTLI
ncbi:MAG: SpoIIE family protein phosphatase, partial [Clostridia bacterium]